MYTDISSYPFAFAIFSITASFSVFAAMPEGLFSGSYFSGGIAPFDRRRLEELVLPILLLGIYDYRALQHDPLRDLERLHPIVRYVIYVCFVILLLLLASFNSQEFVYFQF